MDQPAPRDGPCLLGLPPLHRDVPADAPRVPRRGHAAARRPPEGGLQELLPHRAGPRRHARGPLQGRGQGRQPWRNSHRDPCPRLRAAQTDVLLRRKPGLLRQLLHLQLLRHDHGAERRRRRTRQAAVQGHDGEPGRPQPGHQLAPLGPAGRDLRLLAPDEGGGAPHRRGRGRRRRGRHRGRSPAQRRGRRPPPRPPQRLHRLRRRAVAALGRGQAPYLQDQPGGGLQVHPRRQGPGLPQGRLHLRLAQRGQGARGRLHHRALEPIRLQPARRLVRRDARGGRESRVQPPPERPGRLSRGLLRPLQLRAPLRPLQRRLHGLPPDGLRLRHLRRRARHPPVGGLPRRRRRHPLRHGHGHACPQGGEVVLDRCALRGEQGPPVPGLLQAGLRRPQRRAG